MKTNESSGELTDAQKWMVAGVCVFAALLMRYAGLLALWPRDPDLPACLVTCRYPMLGVLEMVAIGAVTSALVTVAVGKRLPGVGVLAVGLGLLFLGWSSVQWRLVVAYVQSTGSGPWSSVNVRLLGETLGWTATILAALAAERLAREWIATDGAPAGGASASAGRSIPGVYSRSSAAVRAVTQAREQWLMMLAAGLGGIVLIEVLYADSVAASMGQGYFIAFVAMLGGALLGHQVFTCKAIWPAALAWLIPAFAGHLWAMMGQDPAAHWWLKGINPLADMLPIQYAAGGTIGGVMGVWISHTLLKWREEQG